jgi:hypothetical protein
VGIEDAVAFGTAREVDHDQVDVRGPAPGGAGLRVRDHVDRGFGAQPLQGRDHVRRAARSRFRRLEDDDPHHGLLRSRARR